MHHRRREADRVSEDDSRHRVFGATQILVRARSCHFLVENTDAARRSRPPTTTTSRISHHGYRAIRDLHRAVRRCRTNRFARGRDAHRATFSRIRENLLRSEGDVVGVANVGSVWYRRCNECRPPTNVRCTIEETTSRFMADHDAIDCGNPQRVANQVPMNSAPYERARARDCMADALATSQPFVAGYVETGVDGRNQGCCRMRFHDAN